MVLSTILSTFFTLKWFPLFQSRYLLAIFRFTLSRILHQRVILRIFMLSMVSLSIVSTVTTHGSFFKACDIHLVLYCTVLRYKRASIRYQPQIWILYGTQMRVLWSSGQTTASQSHTLKEKFYVKPWNVYPVWLQLVVCFFEQSP